MRICHLSDLHFGHHDHLVAQGLAADLTAQSPDLVIVSGDFTQLGTEAEFQAARAFLDTLETPVFAVPGNHDVPARNLARRFLDPYGLYRRYIHDELEPFLELEGVTIAGIKTSRRFRAELNWAHGSISRGQLEKLGSASPDHRPRRCGSSSHTTR
jgi:3',5'-cyclic AMP phosphodiesterase CpdA